MQTRAKVTTVLTFPLVIPEKSSPVKNSQYNRDSVNSELSVANPSIILPIVFVFILVSVRVSSGRVKGIVYDFFKVSQSSDSSCAIYFVHYPFL